LWSQLESQFYLPDVIKLNVISSIYTSKKHNKTNFSHSKRVDLPVFLYKTDRLGAQTAAFTHPHHSPWTLTSTTHSPLVYTVTDLLFSLFLSSQPSPNRPTHDSAPFNRSLSFPASF
jgi:hypothetical protein